MKRPVVLLALLAALILGAILGWSRGGPPDLVRWRDPIARAAAESRVDAALLTAMVAAESGGRADAVSPDGARGLLQLMPATAADQAKRMRIDLPDDDRILDPETNLRLGAGYLRWLLDRVDGDETFAVAAYNAGLTSVKRWRTRAPELAPLDVILREGYAETRTYVAKVLRWREQYRAR